MKKYITILLSLLFLSFQSAKADFAVGVTAAIHMFDASGTETMRNSGTKKNGSHSESVLAPEIFLEAYGENDVAFGLAYLPTKEVGSKSRTDSNSDGDSGTYKAEAELENVVQFYIDFPVGDYSLYGIDSNIYVKTGIQHATLATLESLNSGSAYPNQDLLGFTLGLGAKGDLPYGEGSFYKADLTYTNFEEYKADSDASQPNTIEADLEDIALKFSIGKRF